LLSNDRLAVSLGLLPSLALGLSENTSRRLGDLGVLELPVRLPLPLPLALALPLPLWLPLPLKLPLPLLRLPLPV
jgi:hypothetical protein